MESRGTRRYIYMGDSIVRNTDSTLNKYKDIVVCLPGARIEHVTERVQRIMGRGNGGIIYTGSHRDEQRRQGGQNRDSEEIQGSTDGDEGSEVWADYLIRDITSVQGYINSRSMAVNGWYSSCVRKRK